METIYKIQKVERNGEVTFYDFLKQFQKIQFQRVELDVEWYFEYIDEADENERLYYDEEYSYDGDLESFWEFDEDYGGLYDLDLNEFSKVSFKKNDSKVLIKATYVRETYKYR